MSNRRFLTSVFVAVSMIALAACGSSGSGGNSSSDEDQISAAVKVVTTSKPAGCKRFETLAFMEQSTQVKGKAAVKSCEEHLKEAGDNPKSVSVSKIDIAGSKATADVTFAGGGFDGQVTTIGFLKEADQWKLNKVESFAKLDRAKLAKVFESRILGSMTKKAGACVLDEVKKAPQPKIEEWLLSGSSEAVTKMIESCS